MDGNDSERMTVVVGVKPENAETTATTGDKDADKTKAMAKSMAIPLKSSR